MKKQRENQLLVDLRSLNSKHLVLMRLLWLNLDFNLT